MSQVVAYQTGPEMAAEILRLEFPEPFPILRRIPNPRPTEFARIQRIGGPSEVVHDKPLLTIECWSETGAYEAEQLAQRARRRLLSFNHHNPLNQPIAAVREAGGIIDLPDPDSQQHRATFSIEIVIRGTAIQL